MQKQTYWYLENIDVTGIFCPKKVDHGALHSEKTFKKGEYIYLPEEQADKIYFLFEGRVKIGNYSEAGKEITKVLLGPGEGFGLMSMLGGDTHRDFAIAMEKTKLCVVPVDNMKEMMREHNQLSVFFMRLLGSRMLEMEQRLESLVFKDSRSRIIEFLINLVQKRGQRVGYEMLVRKFLTHQEIANLTATSRQTVTTVLNELRNKNILTFNRKRLLVRDMELLAKEGEVA
ncbi:MAG: Crp/Fnr family transcriptional regulator [Bacteroidetes bacterium]|nr:Crp/Fnr family transcriptional regulator [Bacteroidota bacterium]